MSVDGNVTKDVKIEIANKVVQFRTCYPYLKEYCQGYDSHKPADLTISITEEDIDYEEAKSAAEDRKEGIPVRIFSRPYLETLAAYRKLVEELVAENILLFHGSALAVAGQGVLFAAVSGTGKSTHARLWREVYGEQVTMINDDKPLLSIEPDGVRVHGTPWNGKHRLGTNRSVPLKAIAILKRAPENTGRKLSFLEAYPMLIQQTYRSKDPGKLAKTLQLLDHLKEHVTFYEICCNMEPEAAKLAYEGIFGNDDWKKG